MPAPTGATWAAPTRVFGRVGATRVAPTPVFGRVGATWAAPTPVFGRVGAARIAPTRVFGRVGATSICLRPPSVQAGRRRTRYNEARSAADGGGPRRRG